MSKEETRSVEVIASDVLRIALSWERGARLLGNVTSHEIARLAASVIDAHGAGRSAGVGDPGVRDPDFVCLDYAPGRQTESPGCAGDGHYLCRCCAHWNGGQR